MRGNSFGTLFRLTTFGESHGPAIGGVVDGCPAGMVLDAARVQVELDRRRPGSTPLGTARNESDQVEFLSGIFEGRTLGTPIGFLLRNADARSSDYEHLKDTFRPGHADRTWEQKFGLRDHRGGGRSSARETACRVVGGAIARQFIAQQGVSVTAFVSQVSEVRVGRSYTELDLTSVFSNDVRCPDPVAAERMTRTIEQARAEGDSLGGMISCIVKRLPPGLGEPVYDRLDADMAKAMLSINATKGFQIGSGFAAAAMRGSEHNAGAQGGVLGGISDGEDLFFDVAFKPPSTIAKPQSSTDRSGNAVMVEGKGRHDPCVVPRAVPIVEAMACLVIADHLLRQRTAR